MPNYPESEEFQHILVRTTEQGALGEYVAAEAMRTLEEEHKSLDTPISISQREIPLYLFVVRHQIINAVETMEKDRALKICNEEIHENVRSLLTTAKVPKYFRGAAVSIESDLKKNAAFSNTECEGLYEMQSGDNRKTWNAIQKGLASAVGKERVVVALTRILQAYPIGQKLLSIDMSQEPPPDMDAETLQKLHYLSEKLEELSTEISEKIDVVLLPHLRNTGILHIDLNKVEELASVAHTELPLEE